MIFKQFRYEPLGQASYLLGCSRAKEAFVVDPIADLGADFYVIEAADRTLGHRRRSRDARARRFHLVRARAGGGCRRDALPADRVRR